MRRSNSDSDSGRDFVSNYTFGIGGSAGLQFENQGMAYDPSTPAPSLSSVIADVIIARQASCIGQPSPPVHPLASGRGDGHGRLATGLDRKSVVSGLRV